MNEGWLAPWRRLPRTVLIYAVVGVVGAASAMLALGVLVAMGWSPP